MVKHTKNLLIVATAASAIAALATWGINESQHAEKEDIPCLVVEIAIATPVVSEPCVTNVICEPWSTVELEAIAKTLAGECYEDEEQDKRKVCEVILNRVSDGRWGSTVTEVLKCDGQFQGYWMQSRPISSSDLAIAKEALSDWYNNGCEALSEYLYFSAGDNHKNKFRSEY